MKKKTLKGLVVGLSALLVAAAGVGAISIITKGFTNSETLKIKPKGQVVDTITFDDVGLAHLSEESENKELINYYIEVLGLDGTSEMSEVTIDQINQHFSGFGFKDKQDVLSQIKFDNKAYKGVAPYFGQIYDLNQLDESDGMYDYIMDNLGGAKRSNKYFDTVRVYYEDLETDVLILYEDSYEILKPSVFEHTYIEFSIDETPLVFALNNKSIPEAEELEVTKIETVLMGEEDETLNKSIVYIEQP